MGHAPEAIRLLARSAEDIPRITRALHTLVRFVVLHIVLASMLSVVSKREQAEAQQRIGREGRTRRRVRGIKQRRRSGIRTISGSAGSHFTETSANAVQHSGRGVCVEDAAVASHHNHHPRTSQCSRAEMPLTIPLLNHHERSRCRAGTDV